MSTQFRASYAATSAAVAKLFKIAAVVFLPIGAFFLAACSDASIPVGGAHPADPTVPVPAVRYRSTIGSYSSQRPVEPAPWGEQNQRVAPQPKSGQ
jgi:hypothetical protein